MDRTCKKCLDPRSQKKTYSTDINMLKRKPANEYYQMLPYYEGKYEPRQKYIDFDSASKVLMKKDDKTVVKRRFERINKMIACKSHIKYEDVPENKELFFYRFKRFKTDNINYHILIGSESDVLYEYNKLFNFWYNEFINKEIEKRDFKITERFLRP